MINQLRLYTINPDLRDEFLARFEKHAARIMRDKYGFTILDMWLAGESARLRFIYLLSWTDKTAMNNSWAEFMANEEWRTIKKQLWETTPEPVLSIEDIVLEAAEFSSPL
ncbi:NIPSNAP family protein [Raoultella terrigena]|uniref:NIPSNAP family protein n=1 Tax=Raoultella terrigena TaxID=577 RepID=UPI001F486332|nr:NIPSNAP family protein [Raoultella terrigena]